MAAGPVPDGGRGEDPARGPVPPGPGQVPARGFAAGGPLDQALPGPALTGVLDRACGPGRCCAGASDDEVLGMLGQWEAAEAWCASARLGVIREMIRRRALPGRGAARPGGLPSAWEEGLTQEVSNQLAISLRAADALIELAWALGERLALTGAALEAGVISLAKARIIAEATAVLDDGRAAAAEALIAGDLAGKTPGQVAAMIARAVVQVDPDGARKRRERAQREDARVRLWREHAGTAALAAFGLPPDEALAANQHIQDRALACKAAGVPGTLDQLRVRAFLDAVNGTSSQPPAPEDPPREDAPAAEVPGEAASDPEGGQAVPGPGGAGPGEAGPHPDGPAGGGPAPASAAPLAANINLTIPLATVLGMADRPGEAHGLGAVDPALARQMAAAAARSDRSTWCVTVTDDRGHAIGHGCAKPARTPRQPGSGPRSGNGNGSRDGPSFTQTDDHGPPGGQGTWQLTMGGRQYTVKLLPIPVTGCDHRYESTGYRPGALLRHLVQVRDGQCTQPTCVRAARRCDFEHAQPWHQGGRTCTCNGGCRCRRDHQVKQSPGWKVEQLPGGYHRWTTPSGRTYTKEPMRYPI